MGTHQRQNQLLEDIVHASLKEANAYLGPYTLLMMTWAVFMGISLSFLVLTICLLAKH